MIMNIKHCDNNASQIARTNISTLIANLQTQFSVLTSKQLSLK